MPSEIVQKENEINVDAKEIIENIEKKNNSSQEIELEREIIINDKAEESKVSEGSSANDNKENEEPAIEDIESLKKRAEELLIDGKRHLIIKDFQAAVDVLSEACSLFGTAYGELAEECAEAYFKYGCALLELSKDQISPVGLEEKDDEENEDTSILESNLTETDKSNVTDKAELATLSHDTSKVVEKKEISADKEEKLDEVEGKLNEKEEEISDEEEKPDDIEEDVNDLQLAWEMFDLAKVIYKNNDTEESKLKLAEVLMKCGEVSIEDEKFDMAIEDMTESLEIRRLLLPEDSRIIAETLFQLGIAQELGGSGDQAIELLTEAAAVLDQRIKILENSCIDNTKEEVFEIRAIIPEIQDRIVDIKERKKAAINALMAAVVGVTKETRTNGGETSTNTKQASNINHLIRKRSKQNEEADGTPNKIPKLEESTDVKQ